MLFKNLNDENFSFYVARYYDNPGVLNIDEFHEDLAKLKYIKRLIRRYKNNKKNIESLKPRLVLNHLIVLYNVFPNEVATRILFLKLEKDLWPALKSFLLFLHRMPEIIIGINNDDILSSNIKHDEKILMELEKL